MNKLHVLCLTTLVAAVATFASPASRAADATKTLDKADRTLSAAEQIAARLKRLGDKLGQPAASTAAGTAATADSAAPGAAAAARTADGSDRTVNDPLASPTRLVGVHGVKLGGSVAETHELLQERGWSFSERQKQGSGRAWSKGNMELGFWDRRGRIERIEFVQSFASLKDGKLDPVQVRQQLIERYGTPELDQAFKDGQVWITWREGASSPAKPSYGPSLKAEVVSNLMRLNFVWPALAKQVSDDYERNRQGEIDNAPKKKAALD
jgi:hypothetical protein